MSRETKEQKAIGIVAERLAPMRELALLDDAE